MNALTETLSEAADRTAKADRWRARQAARRAAAEATRIEAEETARMAAEMAKIAANKTADVASAPGSAIDDLMAINPDESEGYYTLDLWAMNNIAKSLDVERCFIVLQHDFSKDRVAKYMKTDAMFHTEKCEVDLQALQNMAAKYPEKTFIMTFSAAHNIAIKSYYTRKIGVKTKWTAEITDVEGIMESYPAIYERILRMADSPQYLFPDLPIMARFIKLLPQIPNLRFMTFDMILQIESMARLSNPDFIPSAEIAKKHSESLDGFAPED